MQPDEEGLVTLRKSALVNRSWKGHARALLDPASKWQEIRATAMKAGDALLKTLLRKLTPKGGVNQARNRLTACMKELSSMWDFMHAFSSEPTLQETAARVSLVTALVRHVFLQTPRGLGLGGCINDVKACTALRITQAIQKMNQAAPDRHPNPKPEASGQEIFYARNSHTRLLTLPNDILLAQYRTSVPAQTKTPHRLMMWSCELLDILSALSRQGKHRGSFNQRTFSSLPLHGTDEMETAEQHKSLAAILPAPPRHDTELAEKHKLWEAILRTGSRVDLL